MLLSPWNSVGKNTGLGSHSLVRVIFLTYRLNPGFPPCRQILYCLDHQGSPTWTYWIRILMQKGGAFRNTGGHLLVHFFSKLKIWEVKWGGWVYKTVLYTLWNVFHYENDFVPSYLDQLNRCCILLEFITVYFSF